TARPRRYIREPAKEFGAVGGGDLVVRTLLPREALAPDAGCPPQRVHLEAAVVRDRRAPALHGAPGRLRPGGGLEGVEDLQLVLGRIESDTEFLRPHDLQPRHRQERPELRQLASTSGGHEQARHALMAVRCSAKSSCSPPCARSRSASSSARAKVPASPVPCTSTNSPLSSITMLASTSASRSSR